MDVARQGLPTSRELLGFMRRNARSETELTCSQTHTAPSSTAAPPNRPPHKFTPEVSKENALRREKGKGLSRAERSGFLQVFFNRAQPLPQRPRPAQPRGHPRPAGPAGWALRGHSLAVRGTRIHRAAAGGHSLTERLRGTLGYRAAVRDTLRAAAGDAQSPCRVRGTLTHRVGTLTVRAQGTLPAGCPGRSPWQQQQQPCPVWCRGRRCPRPRWC